MLKKSTTPKLTKKSTRLPKGTYTESSTDFIEISKKVFNQIGDDVYIGGVKVTPVMRTLLRDQAKQLQTSQLWELLHSTIVNESADLALKQSTSWDHVLSAKQLYHWQHVLKNMIFVLAKE